MDTSKAVIDKTTHTEIIKSLSEKLKVYYVFPDIAEEICIRLQKHLDEGDYSDIADGNLLADILTQHIQEVNQDKHLIVQWYPDPLPNHEGPMPQDPGWLDEWRQIARFDNYGLHKAERLPGNVGVLDIREFHVASWGGDTAVAAMNFLANTDILIVDLRKCRGGDPDMVALLSSYLFGEERVLLNSLYWRAEKVTDQYWTLPHVPGKRFGDKPVYVLISKDTFSGGEEFAYNLKTRQRATLIGETTKGGAHPGSLYRLHSHFEAFIPNGRAINPITGTNWEGTGVLPDISVPQEQAFRLAYSMALKSIIENYNEATSRPFNLFKEEAQSVLKDLGTS
jgi:Peptidase family S41/N-terminal domain of Peptidase_S41 in eukaryotic IRBP